MPDHPPEGHYHQRCDCSKCQREHMLYRINPYEHAPDLHPPIAVKCDHPDFNASVTVNRLADTGKFNADIKIKCAKCGLPFRFIGLPAGVDLNGAATCADATEARLTIAPKGEVVSAIEPGAVHGFSVRRTEMGG